MADEDIQNDMDAALAAGTKPPEAVFSEMETLMEANLTAAADLSTVKLDFNGLRQGSKTYKDVFGRLKEPVAARFSVMDLNTAEYIVTSTKFLLSSVQPSSREKVQAIRGFGEEYFFNAFGKDVPIYTISGVLINFRSAHDWVRDFKDLYENYLRAYVLVREKWMAVLHYSNRWIRGYPISFNESETSEAETYVPFNMQMVVRKDKMY